MGKAAGGETLGEYLVRDGMISQAQLAKASEQHKATARSLGRVLVDMGLITEPMRITILQKQFGFEVVRLKDFQADQMLLTMIPYVFAEKHRVVPIKQERGTLKVAMEDPSDILLIDALKNQVGMPIQPVVATQEDIQNILTQYQTSAQEMRDRELAKLKPPSAIYRFFRGFSFPVLALGPLIFFVISVLTNTFGVADALHKAQANETLSKADLMLYIALGWALWAIILFEINGLIFGNSKKDDLEEDYA